jgi:manganese efflux pump family protein
MIQIVLIALSLSMDAFAVSISSGMCGRELKAWQVVRACLFFGGFQALMPIIGWFLGGIFSSYIASFDHWIAFGLLAIIGGKMAFEAAREIAKNRKLGPEERKAEACEVSKDSAGGIRKLGSLTILAIATSMDALAVGLSFSVIGQGILMPSLVIGAITSGICFFGLEFGKRLGSAFGEWAEILGGAALVGIGAKIAIDHLIHSI